MDHVLCETGKEWTAKYFQSLSVSTTSLVMWPSKPIPQSVSPGFEKQGK